MKENTAEKYSKLSTYKKELNDSQKQDIEDEKIIKFLTNNQIISTDSCVGSAYIDLYYFNTNGKFAYDIGEAPITDERTISFRGTWKFDNGTLVLNVKEKQIASGGEYVFDNLYQEEVLDGYEKIVEEVDYKLEYDLELLKYGGKEYLYSEDIKLYRLSIVEEWVEMVKNIAEYGYSE
ncbi:MAG: hypothetical protein J6J60_05170 [Clostridia bacterium]|nr:hypothetical protein [Clostridia bacterium]